VPVGGAFGVVSEVPPILGGFACLRNRGQGVGFASYFAASVGCVSESTVRGYIEHQFEAVAA